MAAFFGISMLLKNKIIKFIREDLNCSSNIIENSGSIIFTWNDCKCIISSPSLFSYNITLEDKVIFSGNYFQLLGFFKGYSQNPKEKLKLKDPSKVLLEISKLIGNEISSEKENNYKTKIEELQKKITQLQSNNNSLNTKYSQAISYKKEVQRLNTVVSSQSEELKLNKKEIASLKEDCQEAANLISDLYYKSEEVIVGVKRYKLDHFPKDVQLFIKDLITEYYNK